MKVYVVTAGYEYEGSDVVGVYSTSELAQSCVDKMEADPNCYFDSYQTEECELDE
ncbi:hypothetical protein NVP1060A_21 [Vibrio phage 1.060.A._10N.261.48.B5]|nr:hypothetical protein NVP1060A_21 [Vibrio phage 1.060.A._10N.261.48.B5]